MNQSALDLCFLESPGAWGMVSHAVASDKACGLAGVCVLCEDVPQEHTGGVSGEAAPVQAFSGMAL